jgi:hypothetical protein
MFPFGSDAAEWHVYLGARQDVGQPVEVDVLGIVKGTGYLMFRGNGLNPFDNGHATLPALTGFTIALGAAASFTWGDVDAGLYIKVGGGMDAELGFKPFTLAGNIYVAGELRLWIVSVGADASLTVLVAENAAGDNLDVSIHGQACGHVDFFFSPCRAASTSRSPGPTRRRHSGRSSRRSRSSRDHRRWHRGRRSIAASTPASARRRSRLVACPPTARCRWCQSTLSR